MQGRQALSSEGFETGHRQRRARPGLRAGRSVASGGPAHHHRGQLPLVGVGGGDGAHHFSPPQHRHPLGDGQHLGQLVADERHRQPFCGQPPQGRKQSR